MSLSENDGIITIENEFVRFTHDLRHGAELSGAFVKWGTNQNILSAPQSTTLAPWVRGGWRQYHPYETKNAPAENFSSASLPDGSCSLSFESPFLDSNNLPLNSARISHSVTYHPNGRADHSLTIHLKEDVDLGFISVGSLAVRDDFNRVAVRPCALASWAVELQNPCQWINLHHGKSRSDLPAYRSRFLPLSVLFLKNGVEAVEMSLGDDLSQWDALGATAPGLAQGSVHEVPNPWHYEAVFAPLDSPRPGNIIKKGSYSLSYSIALPFVREKIVPLSVAGCLLKSDSSFENRWPSLSDIQRAEENHFSILRLHNDGDVFHNGIFWHDVAYPPYPPTEMQKMDDTIAAINDHHISVVPYFSCKEWHPDVPPFNELGNLCSRMVIPSENQMETFFGTSLYGIQMCLESQWFDIRKESIRKTLENHAFNGLYFDWCMGLECINPNHFNQGRHWDNDQLHALINWSRETIGRNGQLYLHLTNVPALAIENLGDIILVEESEYFDVFPEMFTPQVHFLNTAPRSICLMLPANNRPPAKLRALALTALLHHATISLHNEKSVNPILELYKEKRPLLESLTEFSRHTAPGEGLATTGKPNEVGISVYWNKDKALVLLANLTETPQTTPWQVNLGRGRTFSGLSDVPPLDLLPIYL